MQSFCNLVRQAQANGFGAFIIAGDLFEGKDIAPSTKTALVQAFLDAPDVHFFLLTGNHDQASFGEDVVKRLPKNVHLFGEGVNRCMLDDVCFVGVDLTSVTTEQLLNIDWQNEYYNVLICHGDIGKKSEYGAIDLDAFYDKPIDYFALGHIHSYHIEGAGRGYAVYSGCLEPRGYDEDGQKGFVRIDTKVLNREYSVTFMPYSCRQAYVFDLDVSDCLDAYQIIEKCNSALDALKIPQQDMVEFRLTGKIKEDCVFTTNQIKQALVGRLFDAKIKNNTRIEVKMEQDGNLPSLKGEFLKVAEQIQDEEMRNIVIRYGLNALNGEEVDSL